VNTPHAKIDQAANCRRMKAARTSALTLAGPDQPPTFSRKAASAVADRTVRPSSATSVYRYFDQNEFLIYVGITKRGSTRNREHNSRADWWPFVARQDVKHFDTREEAAALEKALILRYRPPFNDQHNSDSAGMRAAYLAWTQAAGAPDDPRAVCEHLGRSLPLAPLEWAPNGRLLSLRTEPAHYAVASRLQLFGKRAFIGEQAGYVASIEMRGLFAVLNVVTRRDAPPITQATAHVRYLSQKPVSFRLNSVAL